MQMKLTILTDTSVAEIHETICDTAVEIANTAIGQDMSLAKKWRGGALMNGAPYNEGRLVLSIVEEYQSAPEKVKYKYRLHGNQGLQRAILQHKDLFVGLILGEARQGRNYFDRWPQTPITLF